MRCGARYAVSGANAIAWPIRVLSNRDAGVTSYAVSGANAIAE